MDPNNQHPPIRYLSVCSGMEAASVAWHPLGWKPVGFSEIEPFPCAILKHRFPDTPNYGSLTDYAQWPIERGAADLLVGGTPCQSFSVAGLRKGLEDPRGNLALVFLGLADRIKPRWIVWENVPGVLSSNGGRDFGSFLGALVQLGYGFAYRVLDAQHFGVPQRRRRVFVVACLGDWRAPAEVLLEPDCVRRDPKKGRAKGQGAAAGSEGGVGANGLPIWRAGDQANAEHMIDHAGTVNCNKGSHGGFIAKPISHWEGGDIHPTLNQAHNNTGSPGYSNQELFSQNGAGLVPSAPIPYRKSKRAQSDKDDETWVEGDVSNTLNNFDLGDTRTTHAVVGPIAIQGTIIGRGENAGPQGTGATEGGPMFTLTKTDIHGVAHSIPIQDGREIDKKQNGMGIGQPGDPSYTIDTTGAQSVAHCSNVAPTVTSSGPPIDPKIVQASELRLRGQITEQDTVPTLLANTKSGDNDPLAVHPVAFQPGNLRRQAGADPSTETFPTLKCDAGDQSPHVAYCSEKAGTLTVGHHSCAGHQHRMGDNSFLIAPVVPMAVRRLTPVECERLQGFPDNWSRIPWKGKPEEDCPDGPRYKACGNSMAVPVMRWIGERIAAVEARNISRP